ncbi:MAG: hypothetical protein MJZ75_03855 [Paludibacteraceae bacterium]|nr:hypothetical protein [Paludibacteraceae bacterium]
MSVKHYIVGLVLAVGLMPLSAQRYFSSVTGGTQHFLNLSVSAGALLPTTKGEGLTNQIGADGQIAFSYEIAKRSFFVNLGVGAQYNLSRRRLDHFVDATPAVDPNMHALTYRYVFDNFAEMQHDLMLTVPLQVGYFLTNDLYLAVGAKVQLPFYGTYKTKTNLYTEGEYINLMEYISRNVPSFGYYPEEKYTYGANRNVSLGQVIRVAPGIEFGGLFQIRKRLSCKVAFYAEYSILVVAPSVEYDVVDYSNVASQPGMRNMDNLKENLVFLPITESRYNSSVIDYAGQDILAKAAQNVAFGVRFTLHLNVSRTPKICNCVKD